VNLTRITDNSDECWAIFDDGSGGIMEGANVFDAQDDLHESELLRQGIISWDVIQATHKPVHFNTLLLEGRKEKARLGFVIKGNNHGL
jgi:hypothetical protein